MTLTPKELEIIHLCVSNFEDDARARGLGWSGHEYRAFFSGLKKIRKEREKLPRREREASG